MKRAKYNLIAFLLMAAFAGILILGNVFYAKIAVITVPGSYGETFASQKHLASGSLPDTMHDALDRHYETFTYNTSGKNAVLTKYNGIGEEIVIPEAVDGYRITGFDKSFFENTSLKKVTVSAGVTEFPEEPVETITIGVEETSALKTKLEESGWKTEGFASSEAPDFTLGDIPFEYNETASEVDLKLYTGKDSILVIPSHVNGKPVTGVSFDMLGNFTAVVIPATVTAITGEVGRLLYTKTFAIELIFSILAFIAVLLVLNAKLPKLNKVEEFTLTGPQIILSFLYLIAQLVFACLAIYKGIVSWYMALVISTAMFILYLLAVTMGGTGRKHAQKVTETVKETTQFMDELKRTTAGLADGITDKEVRKAVEKLTEEIRFSPSAGRNIEDAENALREAVNVLKEAISNGDKETILSACTAAMTCLKERNSQARASK